MFSVFIGECGSTAFMLLAIFLLKHPIDLRKIDLKKEHFKQILSLSIPMTSARLLGSFTYFVEPLIFLSMATTSPTINTYGSLNGYVLPILSMPSFLSVTLSNVLLPSFVYEKVHNNLETAKKIFSFITVICLIIGCGSGFVCFFFSKELLLLFFKNDAGADLLKECALPFIFYSLQPVFSALLHAIDQSKQALIDTLIGSMVRIGIVLCTLWLKENTLVIALCSGMLITTFLHAWRVFVSLKAL